MALKLYWPKRGLTARNGRLVGWRRGDSVVVVGIMNEQSPLPWGAVKSANLDLGVVGRAYVEGYSPGIEDDASGLAIRVWISRQAQPIACSEAVQVILFTPPDANRLRFLSLKSSTGSSRRHHGASSLASQDAYSFRQDAEVQADSISDIIPLLNSVHHLQSYIQPGSPSRLALVVDSMTIITGAIGPVAAKAMEPFVTLLQGTIRTTRMHVDVFGVDLGCVQAWSSSFEQIALRLTQVVDLPSRFTETLHSPRVPLEQRSRKYIAFWNTIWLILNDLILGYCLTQIITSIPAHLIDLLPGLFTTFLVDRVVTALTWLNDWPVGLKLNTPLSQFLCTSLGLISTTWNSILRLVLNSATPFIVSLLSIASLGGVTLLLSCLQDILSVLTLHLRCCSLITTRICRWQLDSLGGLWNLFRGKRWNVLRERTDSYAYDVDQLFLGTLLFTVSIFLLPTVLTYSALFASISIGIKGIQATIRIMIGSLNAFPLFALLLRIKESSRLPAGVEFELQRASVSRTSVPKGSHAVFHEHELKNVPLTVNSIFQG